MESSLSKHFGSARSAHSYDRHISGSHRTTSSFVTVNEKRSWRPSSALFQPILDYMPRAAPLALAAGNPFLRLYVERNVEGGGFTMCDYQVIPIPLSSGGCETDGSGCDDRLAGDGAGRVGSSTKGGTFLGTDGGADDAVGYSGASPGTSGMVVEEDGVLEAWGNESFDDGSFRDEFGGDLRPNASTTATRVIPLYINGIGSPQGLSSLSNHHYPQVGVNRVAPTTTQAVSLSLKSNTAAASDLRDRGCLHECWQSAALELSLCVSITCKSDAALQFATLGAWWLSRYYGVSLRLHHMHPAQLPAFKAVQRALFLKEIQLENCVVSEDLLQCISTCADLLSLSIISCSASQQVTLRSIDSILRRGGEGRSNGLADGQSSPTGGEGTNGTGHRALFPALGSGQPADFTMHPARASDTGREITNWYLSGVRSLGALRRLRCLHILHTPLHETFLPALTTCSSLECLILHRCRGVRSLEPLQRLQRLESLSLHGLAVTDGDLLTLGGCSRLRQLVLDECRQISDLSFLAKLSGTLERLLMPRTLLSNTNMRHVALCEKLVELHIQSLRQLTDVGALKTLAALRVLIISDNLVTDQGCSALRYMPSLQRLSLASCRCVTSLAVAVSESGRWTQRLTSLNLAQTNVTDAGLRCLAQCPELRYLNLYACSEVGELGWLRKMNSLRWLNLGGTRVADEQANRDLPSARSLRFLSLSGCTGVRAPLFASKLPYLEYLCLGSTAVTDTELTYLSLCRRLRYLSLESCRDMRDLSALGALPALLELNLSLTAAGVAAGSTLLSASSLGSEGRRTPRETSPSLSAASSPASARSTSPTSSVGSFSPIASTTNSPFRLPVLQVLHINGCSRVPRLGELTRSYPRLRVLYADRISIAPTRGVGIGFAGMEERRRLGTTSRHRGIVTHPRSVSVNAVADERAASETGHKSVTCVDQVLQQYVPQPPVTPRPRSAFAAASRPHPHHRSGVSSPKGRSPSSRPPGEAARVLRLVLRRSPITDAMVEQLCVTFACVSSLDLAKCTDIPKLVGIERLYALRELTLSQSSVDNDGVQAISACEMLEVLRLGDCRNVTDVNCLGSLRRLRALCVTRTNLTNQGLEGVGKCAALQYLDCGECRYLTDVNALSSLRRLVELHLERTDVTDAGIRGVLRCSALQRVYFTRCQRLTTVGEMRAVLPQLEVLDVYGTSIPTRVAGQGQQYTCSVM